MVASIAHKNAHEYSAVGNGKKLKAIYRK